MEKLYIPKYSIDTHQHLWVLSERKYDWISPDYGVLYGDFTPEDVAADAQASGITGTVLVQAADTYEDTFYMLSVASRNPTISAVVGWLPFDRPREAQEALMLFKNSPVIKGFRSLTHSYEDPRWILGTEVSKTMSAIQEHGFTLDMVSVNSEHNQAILELAGANPGLKIVVDHMSKPPVSDGGWEPWAQEMAALAALSNVYCKISGLNTASGPGWVFKDWQPYVDHIVNSFGSHRIMLGSDWPVSLLNGDFKGVWKAQRKVIGSFTQDQQDDIHYRSASKFYSLDL